MSRHPDSLCAAYSLCVGEIRKCIFFGQVACLQTLFHFFLAKLHAFKLSSSFFFPFVGVCWLDDKVKVLFGKFRPISLLLPRMTGRNMWPPVDPVIYLPNRPPLRLRWAHYFRMRDHGSSFFSAVKNLPFISFLRDSFFLSYSFSVFLILCASLSLLLLSLCLWSCSSVCLSLSYSLTHLLSLPPSLSLFFSCLKHCDANSRSNK